MLATFVNRAYGRTEDEARQYIGKHAGELFLAVVDPATVVLTVDPFDALGQPQTAQPGWTVRYTVQLPLEDVRPAVGERVSVKHFGNRYSGVVLKVMKSRAEVRFTTAGGREMTVAKPFTELRRFTKLHEHELARWGRKEG